MSNQERDPRTLDLFPEELLTAEEEHEAATYSIEIMLDNDARSPREDFDPITRMACWHGRYTLGDSDKVLNRHNGEGPVEFALDLLIQAGYTLVDEDNEEDEDSEYNPVQELRDPEGDHVCTWNEDDPDWSEIEGQLFANRPFTGIIALPLYLYDHSGLTMNTTGFSCGWDSGQVGFIYILAKEAQENWPQHIRYNTETREFEGFEESDLDYITRIEDILRSDVETYDQYLRGEVYGFVLSDEDGEEVDSCRGFYGDDPKTNGIIEHLPKHLHKLLG